MSHKIVIVGGGASGFMAAIQAARNGASVTILEQNGKFGRKLQSTGNGKCNLTNLAQNCSYYRSSTPEFAVKVLSRFDVHQTIRFFTDIGIYTKNKNGYLYPHSEQASSVMEVLEMEARNLKIKRKTQEKVLKIRKSNEGFLVATKTWEYPCDRVILACGSKASAIEGADGSGYRLASDLGHTIVKPLPALTGIKGTGRFYTKWAGVRTGACVTLVINGLPLKQECGEVQLTDYGISGIPVFQLSRYAARALYENCTVSMYLDFLPEFDPEGLLTFLKERRAHNPYKTLRESLIGLFSDKLIDVLMIDTKTEEQLVEKIKKLEVPVKETMSFEHAQVCSGGVDLKEINSETMESRLVSGIYFCGELLDVDGACGGYNLQWAWSSGALAGISAARS